MNIDMIRAAADRLKGHARHTPLLSAPALDAIAGRRVLVKAECLQHTGSFKFRGGRAAMSALDSDQLSAGVIAFSSGNHAQGVALAARDFGAPCVIVMPSDAPTVKIANTRALGAEVVLYDRARDDRDAIGADLADDRGLTLIKPFDDPQVIAGQGTAGLEIAADAGALGVAQAEVLVCCGGGGLTSGIALALEADAPDMIVRPVEPEGFDDVARSLATGAIQTNNRRDGSLCDAIITPRPGDLTFPIMQRLCGAGLVVSEQDAQRAMVAAFNHLRIVLEPGGAVALAAALYHPDTTQTDTVIAVATGGNVDPALFAQTLRDFT
ncbi:threonine/serine dehydratase [Octadecabacter sp. R77987]|uniref:threonine ammonia-lyase n=1 Tax=Octadecabacter sp. R77987 TaxID=3093874 RepID=UPI00367174F2